MVIRVQRIAGAADTQKQGELVLAQIVRELEAAGAVMVSFDGIDIATSSFVNTCFVPLLRKMSLQELQRRVRVVKSSRQINDMIKRRLTHEASVAA